MCRDIHVDVDHAVDRGIAQDRTKVSAAEFLDVGTREAGGSSAEEIRASSEVLSCAGELVAHRLMLTAQLIMIHEILPVGPLRCNCSIVGDETSREAMVIDPGDDIADILAIIQKHNLTVKQIVITHAHIDHVGGAKKLRELTGAPILLNENDYALLKMIDVQAAWLGMQSPGKVEIDQSVREHETVQAGSLIANVIHTPGHTEGSICLYFPAEKKLIAGDTLFAGSIGRTDLPGGSFDKIMRSLHEKVLSLPDETSVVPGHGPMTTIGEEREANPFLGKR